MLPLLARVADPKPFGVPSFDERGRIVEITEKPVRPASAFAVVESPAHLRNASARSVRSQVNPGPLRPKWPYAAVGL